MENIEFSQVSKANSVKAMLMEMLINPPDMVVLNFDFSDMNGVEVVKIIRNYLDFQSDVVVVVRRNLTPYEESMLAELKVSQIIHKVAC
ncbi:response regulator [Aerosakkonema funiforme]|uniref:Response regulator n=1 Tax=Aerosakkonema funiforme FACHB-1375 TaxID=2949571 RepID=A0A926VAU2_9CYAN|nr:response regulator [Aerosakkonema funiforme]MBD2180433.1 response regulator [Aerosakkonema funiforme FACHB-1375]